MCTTIRQFRKRANLSQCELSFLLGVNRTTISMWEAGENEPRAYEFASMGDIFNVNIDCMIKSCRNTKNMTMRYIDLSSLNKCGATLMQELYEIMLSSDKYREK